MPSSLAVLANRLSFAFPRTKVGGNALLCKNRLADWQSGRNSFCLDFLVLLYQDKSTKEKK